MASIDSSADKPGRGDSAGALARTLGATREFFVQMAQRPLAFTGMMIVFLFILLAIIGPAVAPYSFREIIRADDRRALREIPPSVEFPFGTDDKGRDVFSR
ncbi:MAG: hypothetical protein AAF653_19210, partial [Chloroflexota bacterium]